MPVRRVTLAVDATLRDQQVLRAATRIAAQLKAEITAMFVTNAELQRFAHLPTATEVLVRSARTRLTEPIDLALDLERLLGTIERELRDFAREADVAWRIVSTTLEQLPDIPSTDLLLVDRRAGATPVSRAELGSVAAKLVADCREPILVFDRELALHKPIGVLLGEDGDGALDMALSLAQASGRLLVLIDAHDRESFERTSKRIANKVAQQPVVLEIDWIRAPHGQVLASSLHRRGAGVLVVDAADPLLQREHLASLLEALRIPVLLARQVPSPPKRHDQ
ncbi:MAG: universal stress protein [Gammaproteobacteria bacterium]|nr:universal stress protein [Gammaproteobacteria bacterium]